jgi:hypothetical protein
MIGKRPEKQISNENITMKAEKHSMISANLLSKE